MSDHQQDGLTDELDSRYSRQILFRPIGAAGQERLQRSRVAVVGMGALGTASASQLARAGVKYLRLIDRDIVEQSNLQRQSLYDESDASGSVPKALAAAEKLRRANSDVDIDPVIADVTAKNAERLLADVDVIVDGTDNFQIRYLINDVSVKHGIPWAYGGAVSSYGTMGLLRPGRTPCLVCLFGAQQGGGHDTCDTVGVIAPIVSMIASLQVAEVIKLLTGQEDALNPGLTYIDVWTNEVRKIRFQEPDRQCACCGQRTFAALSARSDALTVSLCGRRTVQVKPESPPAWSLETVAQRLRAVGAVRHNANLLRCDLGRIQISLFADGRALIHGTDDDAEARALYARYVGM